jgi:hypothetical protein
MRAVLVPKNNQSRNNKVHCSSSSLLIVKSKLRKAFRFAFIKDWYVQLHQSALLVLCSRKIDYVCSSVLVLILVLILYRTALKFFFKQDPALTMTALQYFLLLPSLTTAFVLRTSSTLSSNVILKSKNSDRAHIERNLDEMMGNDWRVFRAKLVAQEQAEVAEQRIKNPSSQLVPSVNHHNDEKLAKQGQLGDIFAGAINSIFHKKNAKQDIFDGDSIGGIMSESELLSEDPFVSEGELPLLIKPKAKIDKHRWAHEIPHVEPGCVLIANEKLGGVFHQTVVLVIQHCEKMGAIGIVINR